MLKRKAICIAVMFSYTGLLLGCNGGSQSFNNSSFSTVNPSIAEAGVEHVETSSNTSSGIVYESPIFKINSITKDFKLFRDDDAAETYLVYADASNKNTLSLSHLTGSGNETLMTGLSNNGVSEISGVLANESAGVLSDPVVPQIKYTKHPLYIMYRDSGTNKFHIKKYIPATDAAPQSITTLGEGYNNYAFKAQNANSVENTAHLAEDDDGNLYVAFINEFNGVEVLQYNSGSNKFIPYDLKYRKGLGRNVREVRIAIDDDQSPILALATDDKDIGNLVLLKHNLKTGWGYYPGTTANNLSKSKVDNLDFIDDQNGYKVFAYNSADSGLDERLHLKRLHYTYSDTGKPKTTYDIQELSNNLSYGTAKHIKLLEDPLYDEYYVSFSDMGASPSIQSNFAPGMYVLAKYNDDELSVARYRQYIDPSQGLVSSDGQPNDVYLNGIDEVVSAYNNSNDSNGLNISIGSKHFYDTASSYANATESPTLTTKKIFYTAQKYSGNLGGFSGADSLCQSDINNPDNLPGASNISKHKWHALLYGNPTLNFDTTQSSYENLEGNTIASNVSGLHDINWPNNGAALESPIDGKGVLGEFWTGYYDYRSSIQGIQPQTGTNNNPFNYSTGVLTVAYAHDPALFSCNAWTTSSSNIGAVYGNDGDYSIGQDMVDSKLNALTETWVQKSKISKDVAHTFNYSPNQSDLEKNENTDMQFITFNSMLVSNTLSFINQMTFNKIYGTYVKLQIFLILMRFKAQTRKVPNPLRKQQNLEAVDALIHSQKLEEYQIKTLKNFMIKKRMRTPLNEDCFNALRKDQRLKLISLTGDLTEFTKALVDSGVEVSTPYKTYRAYRPFFDQVIDLEDSVNQNQAALSKDARELLKIQEVARAAKKVENLKKRIRYRNEMDIRNFDKELDLNLKTTRIVAYAVLTELNAFDAASIVLSGLGLIWQFVDIGTYIASAKSMPTAWTDIGVQGWAGGASVTDVGYNLGVGYMTPQYDFSGNPLTQPEYTQYQPYSDVEDYNPSSETNFYVNSLPDEGNQTTLNGLSMGNGQNETYSYAQICNLPLANGKSISQMNVCPENRVMDQKFLYNWMDQSANTKFGSVDYSRAVRYLLQPVLDSCNVPKRLVCVEE